MFVSMSRADTDAPGTTAPCGSVTRPLTLAVLTVSCAWTGGGPMHRYAASSSPPPRNGIAVLLSCVVAAGPAAGSVRYTRSGGGASGMTGRRIAALNARDGSDDD